MRREASQDEMRDWHITYHKKTPGKKGVEGSHAARKGGGHGSAADEGPVTLRPTEKETEGKNNQTRRSKTEHARKMARGMHQA